MSKSANIVGASVQNCEKMEWFIEGNGGGLYYPEGAEIAILAVETRP